MRVCKLNCPATLTSSISWSCSEVAQRQTRYICLKGPFPWKAGHSEHAFASSAALPSWVSFISCFTLISNSTSPSCTRNSSTENQWELCVTFCSDFINGLFTCATRSTPILLNKCWKCSAPSYFLLHNHPSASSDPACWMKWHFTSTIRKSETGSHLWSPPFQTLAGIVLCSYRGTKIQQNLPVFTYSWNIIILLLFTALYNCPGRTTALTVLH